MGKAGSTVWLGFRNLNTGVVKTAQMVRLAASPTKNKPQEIPQSGGGPSSALHSGEASCEGGKPPPQGTSFLNGDSSHKDVGNAQEFLPSDLSFGGAPSGGTHSQEGSVQASSSQTPLCHEPPYPLPAIENRKEDFPPTSSRTQASHAGSVPPTPAQSCSPLPSSTPPSVSTMPSTSSSGGTVSHGGQIPPLSFRSQSGSGQPPADAHTPSIIHSLPSSKTPSPGTHNWGITPLPNVSHEGRVLPSSPPISSAGAHLPPKPGEGEPPLREGGVRPYSTSNPSARTHQFESLSDSSQGLNSSSRTPPGDDLVRDATKENPFWGEISPQKSVQPLPKVLPV